MQSENRIFGGRYRLVEPIGNGATGIVYRVQDIRMLQNYAMKETTVTTHREAELLLKMDHILFPRVEDWFKENGKYYLVTEYIDGINLEEHVPALSDVLEWSISLAQGLSYLHHLQPPIIHQDIKPSNILLKKDGQIKLIDFGIATELHAGAKREKAYGSYGFAAPEQFGDQKGRAVYPVDERTDIFGLGKTMEFLVGERKKSRRWHAFSQIIAKCTRKEAQRRYQNADDLLYDLNALKNPLRNKYLMFVITGICLLCLCVCIIQGALLKMKEKSVDQPIRISVSDKEQTRRQTRQSEVLDELLYQAGFHCFHEEQDYEGALRYFEQISVEAYEETSHYMAICRRMSDVNTEQAVLQADLMIFLNYIYQQPLTVERMEMLLDICNLYNFAGEEKAETLQRTEPILQEGLRDIALLKSQYAHDEIRMSYLKELTDEYYLNLFSINRQMGFDDEKLKQQTYRKAIGYGERVIQENILSVEETEAVFCQLAPMYTEMGRPDDALNCYALGARRLHNNSAELYADYLSCLLQQHEAATQNDKPALSAQLKKVYERAKLLNEEGQNKKLSAVIQRVDFADSEPEEKEQEEHN